MNCSYIKRTVELAYDYSNIGTSIRRRVVTEMRCVYYALCKEYAEDYTSTKCGKVVFRDHATVLHGLQVFKDQFNSEAWEIHRFVYKKLTKELNILQYKEDKRTQKYNRNASNKRYISKVIVRN